MDLLTVYKALGDDTRFALYLELARATEPLSAAQLADRLGLHPNTVRPHLERMRDAGLLEVEAFHRGTVGRPRLGYALRPEAPWPVPDHSVQAVLAGLLAALAERLGADENDAAGMGRDWGRRAAQRTDGGSCLEALVGQLARLGFEPATEELTSSDPEDVRVRIGFLECPFRELAEAYPDLVCHLHRGIVEGFVAERGNGQVESFATICDRDPCHAVVTVG